LRAKAMSAEPDEPPYPDPSRHSGPVRP
jgi:hypothetical protein